MCNVTLPNVPYILLRNQTTEWTLGLDSLESLERLVVENHNRKSYTKLNSVKPSGYVWDQCMCHVVVDAPLMLICVSTMAWLSSSRASLKEHIIKLFSAQILVEFDGVDWKKREWIRVYEQNAFQVFLIEYTLVWVHNKESTIDKNILWPSLVCLWTPVELKPLCF